MFYLRTILFSILIFILSEAIATTAVTWSFMESTSSSFSFIKISSDNRARDTIVSLAKASESRMNNRGYSELNQTFSRLTQVTSEDLDGFRVLEVSLVSPDGRVLASSNGKLVESPLKKREASEKYSNETFTRALRMRKWQYPDSVILDSKVWNQENELTHEKSEVFSSHWLLGLFQPFLEKTFPETQDTYGLVSSAVYHETKLDVVGAVHLIYSRGNFELYMEKQKEMYLWMLWSYSVIAFVISVVLILLYILFSYFNRKDANLSKKTIGIDQARPPIIEKVITQEEDQSILEKVEDEPVETGLNNESPQVEHGVDEVEHPIEIHNSYHTITKTQPGNGLPETIDSMQKETETSNISVLDKKSTIVKNHPPVASIAKKKIVVDAVYLGEYGD